MCSGWTLESPDVQSKCKSATVQIWKENLKKLPFNF